jgi:hypothetical protein
VTPVERFEFELELLAFNTRPQITYVFGSRAPALLVRVSTHVLEFPEAWLAAKPGPRRRARRRHGGGERR